MRIPESGGISLGTYWQSRRERLTPKELDEYDAHDFLFVIGVRGLLRVKAFRLPTHIKETEPVVGLNGIVRVTFDLIDDGGVWTEDSRLVYRQGQMQASFDQDRNPLLSGHFRGHDEVEVGSDDGLLEDHPVKDSGADRVHNLV